jgi:hypothetical protein
VADFELARGARKNVTRLSLAREMTIGRDTVPVAGMMEDDVNVLTVLLFSLSDSILLLYP